VETVNYLLKKYTWVIIFAGIIFSFLFPEIGINFKPYLNYLLGFILFLSCLDLNFREILGSLIDFKAQALVLAITHLVTPIIVFFLRDYFSPEIFLGLIIAATLPAGRSAVFLCNLYGGNPSKALTVTSISNALSPITVPALVWVFAHTTIKVDTLQMSYTILYLVIIPLILALLVGKTKVGKSLNQFATPASTISLFFIILGIISPLRSIIFSNLLLSLILLLIVCLFCIINFFLGTLIKTDLTDKVTYGLSSSYKNYTLGTILSLSVFSPIVALPSIAYTVANNILLVPLQFLLNRRPPTPPTHHSHHHRTSHSNLLFFIVGLIGAIALSKSQLINYLLPTITSFPLIAAPIAGLLFSSTFTVALGGLIIVQLTHTLPIIPLIILAGLGAVSSDLLMFLFVKKNVSREVADIYSQINHHNHLRKILHTRYFAWTLPVLGALIIASPFPDELAISLLGLSQTTTSRFLAISLTSHLFGISMIILGAKII